MSLVVIPGFPPGPTQTGKIIRGLKFQIQEIEELFYCVAKTKALISFAVTTKLICVFVFAYARSRFSHDTTQILSVKFSRGLQLTIQQYRMGN